MREITVYKVTATSLDDGHRCSYGFYISQENAEEAAKSMDERMNALWSPFQAIQRDDGHIIEIGKAIEFQDDKERILKKLTKQERQILGL